MTEFGADEHIRQICLGFDQSYEKLSHGKPSYFVQGGKQFAMAHSCFHSDPRPQVWVLATLPEQEALLSLGDPALFRPPYVGHRGWIAMYLDGAVDWAFLADLLERGHALASPAQRRLSR